MALVPGWGMLTPLHYACEGGHLDTAQCLLDLGADPFAIDACGWTPLHWAARCGHAALCLKLAERGADVHARDFRSLTPIDICHIFRNFYLGNMLDSSPSTSETSSISTTQSSFNRDLAILSPEIKHVSSEIRSHRSHGEEEARGDANERDTGLSECFGVTLKVATSILRVVAVAVFLLEGLYRAQTTIIVSLGANLSGVETSVAVTLLAIFACCLPALITTIATFPHCVGVALQAFYLAVDWVGILMPPHRRYPIFASSRSLTKWEMRMESFSVFGGFSLLAKGKDLLFPSSDSPCAQGRMNRLRLAAVSTYLFVGAVWMAVVVVFQFCLAICISITLTGAWALSVVMAFPYLKFHILWRRVPSKIVEIAIRASQASFPSRRHLLRVAIPLLQGCSIMKVNQTELLLNDVGDSDDRSGLGKVGCDVRGKRLKESHFKYAGSSGGLHCDAVLHRSVVPCSADDLSSCVSSRPRNVPVARHEDSIVAFLYQSGAGDSDADELDDDEERDKMNSGFDGFDGLTDVRYPSALSIDGLARRSFGGQRSSVVTSRLGGAETILSLALHPPGMSAVGDGSHRLAHNIADRVGGEGGPINVNRLRGDSKRPRLLTRPAWEKLKQRNSSLWKLRSRSSSTKSVNGSQQLSMKERAAAQERMIFRWWLSMVEFRYITLMQKHWMVKTSDQIEQKREKTERSGSRGQSGMKRQINLEARVNEDSDDGLEEEGDCVEKHLVKVDYNCYMSDQLMQVVEYSQMSQDYCEAAFHVWRSEFVRLLCYMDTWFITSPHWGVFIGGCTNNKTQTGGGGGGFAGERGLIGADGMSVLTAQTKVKCAGGSYKGNISSSDSGAKLKLTLPSSTLASPLVNAFSNLPGHLPDTIHEDEQWESSELSSFPDRDCNRGGRHHSSSHRGNRHDDVEHLPQSPGQSEALLALLTMKFDAPEPPVVYSGGVPAHQPPPLQFVGSNDSAVQKDSIQRKGSPQSSSRQRQSPQSPSRRRRSSQSQSRQTHSSSLQPRSTRLEAHSRGKERTSISSTRSTSVETNMIINHPNKTDNGGDGRPSSSSLSMSSHRDSEAHVESHGGANSHVEASKKRVDTLHVPDMAKKTWRSQASRWVTEFGRKKNAAGHVEGCVDGNDNDASPPSSPLRSASKAGDGTGFPTAKASVAFSLFVVSLAFDCLFGAILNCIVCAVILMGQSSIRGDDMISSLLWETFTMSFMKDDSEGSAFSAFVPGGGFVNGLHFGEGGDKLVLVCVAISFLFSVLHIGVSSVILLGILLVDH
eukprot:GHVN01019498.1.p1 GENE.GHVN01019498.1~~GHVN01019498.1.p1  ORF type:complete len:1399 (-),score=278.63 GHVN01019498.1:1398-5219(-)